MRACSRRESIPMRTAVREPGNASGADEQSEPGAHGEAHEAERR